MKRNIYITDLDGTLLNRDAKLSPFAAESIGKLIEMDVLFSVASARSVKSIQTIFAGIDLKLPIIEFNGAFISDLKTGRHLVINSIGKSSYESLLEEFLDKGLNCFVSTFNGTEDKLYYDKISNEGAAWYVESRTKNRDSRLEKVSHIKSINDPDPVCITVIDIWEKLQPDFDRLKSINDLEVHLQENPYSPGWFWLTVHDRRATKDQAIRALLEIMQIEDSRLTAFGDNTNDIKMLRSADRAIVVKNAKDELKAVAHEIIDSNEEDGVIKYILEKEGFTLLQRTTEKNRLLIDLENQLAKGVKEALDHFWREIEGRGTPLIEKIDDDLHNDLVTFLFRADSDYKNVTLLLLFPGGLSNLSDHDMDRIEGTDLWYSSYLVRNDLRFRYEFSPDDPHDDDWTARRLRGVGDSFNRNLQVFKGDDKTFPYVVMSQAKEHLWSKPRDDVPKGDLKEYFFESPGLDKGRKIRVYTPPGYSGEEGEYGFLVLNDGEDYMDVHSAHSILDNLISEEAIPPVIAVFIDSSENRHKELCCDDGFIGIIAREIVPWLREQYPLSTNPGENIIGGFSAGGLTASYMGLKYPDVFGNVLSQSGYFCYDPEETWNREEPCWIGTQFTKAVRVPLKFYLNIGILESPRMIDANGNLRDILVSQGYTVNFEEFAGGHDHLCWGETLATGLIALIGLT